MEQVATASGTSKSQLYRNFPSKEALVHAVIELRAEDLIALHTEILKNVRSIRGLERWRDVLVGRVESVHGAYGCSIGAIATEIAEDDAAARVLLQGYFKDWEGLLTAALAAMVHDGELSERADPESLAQQIMVAVQGGYVLSQVERSAEPMRRGLDMAIDYVRRFRAEPPGD